jgi:DNA integrity scanning protein DisA with diadenylate cyclase activity
LNSSWVWFTENPITILPLVILFTLLVETIMIIKINKMKKIIKSILVIVLANLISFLLPYIILGALDDMYYLKQTLNKLPIYIINTGYLIITIIIEIPIVYNMLKGNADSKKKLIISTMVVNIVTTLATVIIEHIKYRGSW